MANIKTYARIKPGPRLYPEYKTASDTVTINTVPGYNDWVTSSSKNSHADCYKFSHVFPHDTPQEDVFDTAAKGIVEAFLNGYNGTIFAYGQTGSGKTYTMEGTARLFKDRGLAPRAISMIYNALAGQSDADNSVHVSYLEIYQEVGYDLLNPAARNSSTVTPFPKVVVLDCMGGSCLVKNLSSHLAASEAVAQSLLLQGQANRKVAETPMNQRSSRSHAVLTLQLTSRKSGSDIITRSKLHLVDLAGSERVAKTRTEGLQLTEAKYINLSLHHLEGVIIALQHIAGGRANGKSLGPWTKSKHYKSYSPYNMEWGKQTTSTYSMTRRPSDGSDIYQTSKHIPYRNSLLTMVLKDSLGGNCMTAMIATLNMEYSNLGETLSTCRFAQRVACITNRVRRNEEIDDKSLIRQLQHRIGQLEAELTLIKMGQYSNNATNNEETVVNSKLTDEDKIFCEDLMKDFVIGKVKNPLKQGISTPQLFCQCLKNLKDLIVNHVCQNNSKTVVSTTVATKPERPPVRPSASADDLKKIIEKEEKQEKIVLTRRPASSGGGGSRRRTSTDPNPVGGASGDRPPSGSSSRGTSGKYKSPYEKKREKEIKKLNEKIEKALDHQLDEEKKMHDWKAQIKQEQLQMLMKEISHKADLTREQLASQHAYILKLKHEGADPAIIKQERIAEKQLRKKEAKIERRLQHVKQKLDLAKPSEETDRPPSGQTRPKSVEEKFGQLRKSDGTLNTRQVLEKLQLEERKHQIKESKLKQQRIHTVAEELELREAATRQKLQEFKEKLRMFRDCRNSPGPLHDRTFNSSGYESLPLSDFNGLNTTDNDKSELLATFASQKFSTKSNAEKIPNTDLSNEDVVSAFKPYKGSGKIVPKSGWLDGGSGGMQNGIEESGSAGSKGVARNGRVENGAHVSNHAKTAESRNGFTSCKNQEDYDLSAFKSDLNEMNKENSEKDTNVGNYPFIHAALRDQETVENGDKSAFKHSESGKKSTPLFAKPPLPNRQESSVNGWAGDPSKQHQPPADKWNSAYSPVSSRPSTGERWRSSSMPPKTNEKQVSVSEKWNSGTASRPSSGNSADVFSSNGDINGKWDMSYRTGSPFDSWSGVRPGDLLRTKSESPNDFAQSYDVDGLLGDMPPLIKSHSIDVTARNEESNAFKTLAKSERKSDSSKRNHERKSRQHRKEKNRKNVSSFDDFRDSAPSSRSKTISFPEPANNEADNTYLPSEVYAKNDLDLRRMSLRGRGFDSTLNSMLNGERDVFEMKSQPVAKSSKPRSQLFDVLLKAEPLDDDPPSQRIQAYKEEEREPRYMEKARHEKERVARIRRVRNAAEVIQRFWRKHRERR